MTEPTFSPGDLVRLSEEGRKSELVRANLQDRIGTVVKGDPRGRSVWVLWKSLRHPQAFAPRFLQAVERDHQ